MFDFPLATITIPSLEATELEELLIYLKQVQQVDLTGYKRSSLLRRIGVRMQQVGVDCYQDYLDHLQRQPNEVTQLLDTIFINVTCFFRDRPVWDYLKNQVIPRIVANKPSNEPIRVWSAACASGEETYSLAMLLAEALGLEQFQKRVRIWGTDVDRDALVQARRGYYSSEAVELIPPNLLERYFEPTTDGYCWRSDLSHPINFLRHNLIKAAPLVKMDLLVCRNMLMYLTPEAQIRALVRFHFSLSENGFLMLGQAEALVTRDQNSLFTCIDREVRLFTKVPDAHRNGRLLPIAFCS